MAQNEILLRLKGTSDFSDIQSDVAALQKHFSKLNLPKNVTKNLENNFDKLDKELQKFQEHMNSGFKTKGDVTGLEKSGQKIIQIFNTIESTIDGIDTSDLKKAFQIDTSKLDKAQQDVENIKTEIKNKLKLRLETDNSGKKIRDFQSLLNNLYKTSKTKKLDVLRGAVESGDIQQIKAAVSELGKYGQSLEGNTANAISFNNALKQVAQAVNGVDTNEFSELNNKLTISEQKVEELSNEIDNKLNRAMQETPTYVGSVSDAFKKLGNEIELNAKNQQQFNNEMAQVKDQVAHFFSLINVAQLLRRAFQDVYNTVKELDEVMTETAVVTDFSIGDMWDKLPEYTAQAKALGVATKDLYAATTLYYQQGLDTNASMAAGVETMKMARIAGMEATQATDAMTAALRGFNMEVNETNAQNVNDVYSKLAAITASDTEEIATAMSKTAAIANSVGAEFENIAVFLAQGIETTRESADAIGTAMKTILARFNEMKKDPSEIGEIDGEIVDANKVETALRSVGIALRDTNGEFRNADQVLLEVAQKWDSMSVMQQRYIATTAAGSRQQSRFIAFMQDYNRTMELQTAAYNAEGAAQQQYEKTLESLDAKVAKLKDTWDEFILGIANSDLIKGAIDFLSGLLNIINKMTNAPGILGGVLKSLMAFGIFKGGKALIGKGGIGERLFDASQIAKEAARGGKSASEAFREAFENGSKKLKPKNFITEGQEIGHYYSIGIKKGFSINNKTNNLIDFSSVFKEMDDIQKKIDENMEIQYTMPDLDLTELEELDGELYSLGSRYQEVSNSVNGLNSAQLGILKTQVDSNKITATELSLMSSKQIGLYANAVAEGNEAMATKLATDAKAKKIALEKGGIAALLTKIGLTIQGNIQQGTETILTWEQVKALIAETIAQQGVNSAMLIGLGVVGAIIVAVGLLVVGIVAIVKAYQNWSKQGELAAQKTQALAERAKEAKEEYDNLKDSLDSLKEQQKTIDSLGKGTAEWKMAVAELNQQILDLLKTYPFLAEFIKNDGGVLTIDPEGYDEILNTQAQIVKNAQASAAASTIADQTLKKERTGDDDESKVYNEYFDKLKDITQDMYLTPTYTGNQQQIIDKYPAPSGTSEKIPVVNLERAAIDNLVDLFNKGKLTKEDVEAALIGGQNGTAPGREEWEAQINQIMGLIPQVAQGLSEVANAASLNAQILVQSANDLEGYSDGAANFISKYVAGDLENRTWKDENGKIVKSSNDEAVWSNYEKMLESQYSGYDIQIKDQIGTNATVTRTKDGVTEYMQSDGSFSTTEAKDAVGQEYAFQTVSNYKKAQLTDDDKKMAENYEHLSDKNKDYMDLILSSGLEVTSEELKGIFDEEGKLVKDSFQTLVNRYEQAYGDIDLNRKGAQLKQETENASAAGSSAVQAMTGIASGEGVQNEQELLSTLEQVDGLYDELGNAAQEWAVVSNKGVIEQMSYLTALSQQQYQNKQETIDKAKEERQAILDAITALEGIKPGEAGYEEAQARIEELRKSLTSTDWVLEIEVTDNFDDVISATKAMISSFDKVAEAAELVGKGFTVSAENAQELSDMYPGILKNATVAADGQIKLDQSVADSKLGTAEEAITANAEAQKAIIYQEQARLDAAITAKTIELGVIEQTLAKGTEANQAALLADLANEGEFSQEMAQIEQDQVDTNLNALEAKGINTMTYGQYELDINEDAATLIGQVYEDDVANNADAVTQKGKDQSGFLSGLKAAAAAIASGNWAGAWDAFWGGFTGSGGSGWTAGGAGGQDLGTVLDESAIFDDIEIVKTADGKLDAKHTLENYYNSGVAELEEMKAQSAALTDQITIIDAAAKHALNKINNPGGDGGSGGSGGKDKDFDYDEYFNQQQKLAKLQVDRNKLEREYEKIIEAEIVDLEKLEENQKAQLENLQQQKEIEEWLKQSRIDRMNALEKEHPDFSRALWFDDELGTLQIDEEEMAKIGNMSPEYIEAFNEYYDMMMEHNDAQLESSDSLLDIESDIVELTGAGRIELDKSFNTLEKVEKSAEHLKRIEEEINSLLSSTVLDGEKLSEAYSKQIEELQEQKKLWEEILIQRQSQYDSLLNSEAGQSYLNSGFVQEIEEGVFEINWDLLGEEDQDIIDAVVNFTERANEASENLDEATESVAEFDQQLRDTFKGYLDDSTALIQEVRDVLQESYQKQIDAMQEVNDTMNDSASKIMDSIQKSIDEQRQNRENSKTEEDISDMEARLAYLRQDTSGANQIEILSLEEQLSEAKEDYTDTLIDQKISALQEQNDKAFEQRQLQIDIAQKQLDAYVGSGGINEAVNSLITNGIKGGDIIPGSPLENLLNSQTTSLSTLEKMEYWNNVKAKLAAFQQLLNGIPGDIAFSVGTKFSSSEFLNGAFGGLIKGTWLTPEQQKQLEASLTDSSKKEAAALESLKQLGLTEEQAKNIMSKWSILNETTEQLKVKLKGVGLTPEQIKGIETLIESGASPEEIKAQLENLGVDFDTPEGSELLVSIDEVAKAQNEYEFAASDAGLEAWSKNVTRPLDDWSDSQDAVYDLLNGWGLGGLIGKVITAIAASGLNSSQQNQLLNSLSQISQKANSAYSQLRSMGATDAQAKAIMEKWGILNTTIQNLREGLEGVGLTSEQIKGIETLIESGASPEEIKAQLENLGVDFDTEEGNALISSIDAVAKAQNEYEFAASDAGLEAWTKNVTSPLDDWTEAENNVYDLLNGWGVDKKLDGVIAIFSELASSLTGYEFTVGENGAVNVTTPSGFTGSITGLSYDATTGTWKKSGEIDFNAKTSGIWASLARMVARYADGLVTDKDMEYFFSSQYGIVGENWRKIADYDGDGQIDSSDAKKWLGASAKLNDKSDAWNTAMSELMRLVNILSEEEFSEQFGTLMGFSTGGVADFTGPAWLDGTKSKPELILNQRDTQNFIQLKDILASVMKNANSIHDNEKNGDTYYEIHIEVDKLTNDYDVDDVARRVQQIIVTDANYRNVNLINRLR